MSKQVADCHLARLGLPAYHSGARSCFTGMTAVFNDDGNALSADAVLSAAPIAVIVGLPAAPCPEAIAPAPATAVALNAAGAKMMVDALIEFLDHCIAAIAAAEWSIWHYGILG
jgi:hypothetical protein